MDSMHLPKRALQNAGAALCAVALVCCTAVPGHALSRTNRAHAHPVAQEQEPVPSKSKAKKPAARTAAKAPVAKPSAKATKAHSGKQVPQPRRDDDYPVTMKRAHGAKPALHGQPLIETRVEHHVTHTVITHTAVAKAQPKPAAPKPAQVTAALDAAADKAAAEKKTLTTDDFLRAASGAPDAPITGESHPDEMDETAPLIAAKPPVKPAAQPVITASVSADDTPKAPAAPTRVDGFGPEGASAPATGSGHRTIAATLAARKSRPVPPPVVSAEERAEITDEVVKPMVLPALYTRGGRLVMPAPLKGSHEVLVHQNIMADNDGLDRIQDDDDLNRMVAAHLLLRLPESDTLHVNSDLPENRRYARPWTVRFVTDAARAYEAHFGIPLQVNSAVRTVNFQLRLMRTNGNAANVDGDTASPHLTGQAIDIAKRGMSKAQLAWMRTYLLPLMQAGKVDVEEEFQQACFHISVYRAYLPKKKATRTEVAAVRHDDDSDAPDAPPIRRTGPSLR